MTALARVLEIMRRLRSPDAGCPWDRAQTFSSVAPYTIEEAYEVADAIEREDMTDLKDELGDLLFQVVFHAEIAQELGEFDFEAVAAQLEEKLIRRHPHVFERRSTFSADEQSRRWEAAKMDERLARDSKENAPIGVLDGVPLGLPAPTRALKLQQRAATVGFDWGSVEPVIDKLSEEVRELREEYKAGRNDGTLEELGDLMFTCVNLARHLGSDPEALLRAANTKFEKRFRRLESELEREGRRVDEVCADKLDSLWERVKAAEDDPGC